jgi:hypothetical protein
VASQEAIKMLGTNDGGFFNANSAHPFENPTPFTNFLQMLAIFAIPAGADLHLGEDDWVPAARRRILAYVSSRLIFPNLILSRILRIRSEAVAFLESFTPHGRVFCKAGCYRFRGKRSNSNSRSLFIALLNSLASWPTAARMKVRI